MDKFGLVYDLESKCLRINTIKWVRLKVRLKFWRA